MLPISTSCETGVCFQSKERPSRSRLFALLWPPICWRVLELVLVPKVPRWICWNHEFVHRAKACKWPGRMQCPVHGLWLGRNGWAWKFRNDENPWTSMKLKPYGVVKLLCWIFVWSEIWSSDFDSNSLCPSYVKVSLCGWGQKTPLEMPKSVTPQLGTPFSPLK